MNASFLGYSFDEVLEILDLLENKKENSKKRKKMEILNQLKKLNEQLNTHFKKYGEHTITRINPDETISISIKKQNDPGYDVLFIFNGKVKSDSTTLSRDQIDEILDYIQELEK